ncbi:hypothetical protein D9623_28665 (plasmid) [Azospirillum brasilense]|uniref:Uncharacterized protein n=1 Tax=Azospirillum brasilense TaxID=192 RepID=A0A4D8R5C3_AZOBR|nr:MULTISPECIES: hypothetical protein [Azospirillum]MDW7554560.1 hypothetical protein [Azospirillum brasilense]MDW7593921.1 hypothetical protein [Azospirillum brasilense]MDW7632290.1 hypothetical protein [Azospirillum brasilense]MDX5950109.1 hypothetical protein [Azospirillum brasilense]OPH13248.1 hypothetical protein FE89_23185 [Azospirillum brasilense]
MAKEKVAGKDFEVVRKPRARKPKETPPSLAQSAYLTTVMNTVAAPVEHPPPPMVQALDGDIFPPLPEGRIPQTVDEFINRISELWEDAQQRFLRIGELLSIAETRLSEEDRAALYEGLNRRFGKSARSQLMSAYRAIRDNVVPVEVAAAGYGTVYMLARLSDDERRQAAERGLLRSDVRQSEVRQFWKALRGPAPSNATRRAELEARRAKLLLDIQKIDDELAGLID